MSPELVDVTLTCLSHTHLHGHAFDDGLLLHGLDVVDGETDEQVHDEHGEQHQEDHEHRVRYMLSRAEHSALASGKIQRGNIRQHTAR